MQVRADLQCTQAVKSRCLGLLSCGVACQGAKLPASFFDVLPCLTVGWVGMPPARQG
jgi:hypothetical protein